MTNFLYSWSFEQPFHSIFLAVTTILSLCSNSLLLFIIHTTASDLIGSYRFLLAYFALCDIATSIAHATLQPYVHMTSTGFYFLPGNAGTTILGMPCGSILCVMFIATYYQTFIVLAYHFVYRYKTVTRGIGVSFTNNWTRSNWILVGAIVNVLYISAFCVTVSTTMMPTDEQRYNMPPEVLEFYGVNYSDPHNGFTVVELRRLDPLTNGTYWKMQTVASLGICLVIFAGTAGVIVFCIYQTNAAIKFDNISFQFTKMVNDDHFHFRSADLTARTRNVHHQLFKALLIQTMIPCLFSYVPLSIILVWPFTGISLGAFGNVLYMTTAIFPSIDAFFVLFFIVKFRVAVIRLFHLPFKTVGMGSSVEQRDSIHINVVSM